MQKVSPRQLELHAIDDGQMAKAFAKFSGLPHFRLFRKLAMSAVIKAKPEGSLLDVGCGGGWFLRDVNKRYPHLKLTGCDLSEPMLVYSKKLLGVKATIVEGDAQNLPFRDNTFDCVTSTLAFHHFPYPDKSISEFRRVLKPNGLMAVTDFRRDCSSWTRAFLGFVTKYVVPRIMKDTNEPLGSLLAAMTYEECKTIMANSAFTDYKVTGNGWQILITARK